MWWWQQQLVNYMNIEQCFSSVTLGVSLPWPWQSSCQHNVSTDYITCPYILLCYNVIQCDYLYIPYVHKVVAGVLNKYIYTSICLKNLNKMKEQIEILFSCLFEFYVGCMGITLKMSKGYSSSSNTWPRTSEVIEEKHCFFSSFAQMFNSRNPLLLWIFC